MNRRARSARVALLALLLCAGTFAPASSRAADTPATTDGIQNVLRYMSCALGIARAQDPMGATIAWSYCLSLLKDATD